MKFRLGKREKPQKSRSLLRDRLKRYWEHGCDDYADGAEASGSGCSFLAAGLRPGLLVAFAGVLFAADLAVVVLAVGFGSGSSTLR